MESHSKEIDIKNISQHSNVQDVDHSSTEAKIEQNCVPHGEQNVTTVEYPITSLVVVIDPKFKKSCSACG